MLGQGWTIIYRIESNGRPIHALRIEEATNGLVWNQMPNFLEFAIDSIEQMTKHPLTDKGIEQFLEDWKSVEKK
jgi:transaldolase